MPLFRRGVPRPGLTDTVTVSDERDRADLVAHLRDGLAELAERDAAGVPVHELQLLVQVCGAQRYAAWRAGREKRWRTSPCSTSRWPASLPPEQAAVLLLPIPAGRVGPAVGPHPRNTLAPLFTRVDAAGAVDDAALALVRSWVCNPGPGITARPAPPIIEQVGHGRRAEAWGLAWTLPVADGI